MYCIKCGNKLGEKEKFCTKCGKKILTPEELVQAPASKGWHWKTIILSLLISSLFWFFYYFGLVDKSSESVNVMTHLIETVGRQRRAWEKSEQIVELMSAGLSDECIYTAGCIDEVVGRITTLRAEIDTESSEIENLWSENVIGHDFEVYFLTLDESSQTKLMDVLDIYFPEETEELETTNQLI